MGKTVFVNRYFFPDHSATSQLLTDLAFALARDSESIHIVTSRQRYDDANARLAAFETTGGVTVHRVWTSTFGRHNLIGRAVDYATFYLSAAWRLFFVLRRDDVVVAKTDPPLISVVAVSVAWLRGAVLVNWLQDVFPEVGEVMGVRAVRVVAPVLRALRNLSLRSATHNVVLGERMAVMVERQNVARSAISVIHNWSDGDAIYPIVHNENALRIDWGLNGKFVVGYSGNMGRVHEFSTLLDAAQRLVGETNIVFLFIGSGAQRASIENEARQRGLANIIFKPYQPRERLAQSLTVADIQVISLRPELEGLIVPSKFYGIAAAGRATLYIGDPSGEIPNILAAHRCGFSARVGDVEAVVRSIISLAHDHTACETMGRNARVVFDQCYTQKMAFDSWRQVLHGPAVESFA